MDESNEGSSKATVDDLSIKKNEEVSQVAIPNAIAAVSINNIPGIKGIEVDTSQTEDNNQLKEISACQESSKKSDGLSPIGQCIAFICVMVVLIIPVTLLLCSIGLPLYGMSTQNDSLSSKNVANEQSSQDTYFEDNEFFSMNLPAKPEISSESTYSSWSSIGSSSVVYVMAIHYPGPEVASVETKMEMLTTFLKAWINTETDEGGPMYWFKEKGYLNAEITDSDIQTGFVGGCPAAYTNLNNDKTHVRCVMAMGNSGYFTLVLFSPSQSSIDEMLSSFTVKQP